MGRQRGFFLISTLLLTTAAMSGWAAGCSSSGSTDGETTTTPQTECTTAVECDDANACTTDACTAGQCESAPVDGDAPEQVPGDCKKVTCAAGALETINDATDAPDDAESCTIDACSNGVSSHTPKSDDAPCTIGAGSGFCESGVCTVECEPGDTCPDDDNPCTVDSCDEANGKCAYDALDAVPTPGAVAAADCVVQTCVAGVDTAVVDDNELPDDGNECTDDVCTRGTPSNPPLDADTACGANLDMFCDGQGTCGECNDALTQCPFTAPCEDPVCTNHTCAILFKPLNDASPMQLPGDCTAIVCDGAGATKAVNDDNDVEDDLNDCTQDVCVAGVPGHIDAPQLFPCATGQCDGVGVCRGALGVACAGVVGECATGLCVDDVCCDGACSGSCDACAASLGALADGTCTPLPASAPGTPTCAPYACSGVDASCATACASDGDCVTGTYCSGGACIPSEVDGIACSIASHCQSGFCTDGVCCDAACGGLCDACTTAKKGAGADGACAPIGAGSDPDSECNVAVCFTGQCDGASACEASSPGTACGLAQSCAGTLQTNQDTCDGTGTCVDNLTTSCAPYICGGAGCKTSCTIDGDCSAGNFCTGGACGGKLANGAVCSGANQCSSGSCVDGVCCGSSSCPSCQACDVNGAGTCANMPSGAKDATAPSACAATQTCNGAGSCKDDDGQVCASAASCFSTFCADGRCCGTACSGSCDACSVAAGGAVDGTCSSVAVGSAGTPSCAPFLCGGQASCPTTCVGNGDCTAGSFCGGGVCTGAKANGATCTTSPECSSGNCVDGFCCNSTCAGLCAACSASKKGSGLDGTCGNIGISDPDGECAATECATGQCNGFGACEAQPSGFACGDLASCIGGVRTLADSCNGAGTCTDYGSLSCGNYLCSGVSCGTSCVTDTDCATSGYCSGGVCVPDCTQDQNCPSFEYCNLNTSKCTTKSLNGTACTVDNECTSAFCVDSVCCGTACTGFCQACSIAKKGNGADGSCSNIFSLDPDGECPNDECTTGLCSNGACSNLVNNSACGDSASCAAGTQTNQDTCNGAGVCTDKGTVACGNFACNGATCFTSCSLDSQCSAGNYCHTATSQCVPSCVADSGCSAFINHYCDTTTSKCAPKGANGAVCTAGNQCLNTFCVDGVCCNSACSSLCQACSAAKKGQGSSGGCGNIALGLDPDSECALASCQTGACNGSGACGNNPINSACDDSLSCTNGVQTNQDTCTSGGTCTDKGTTSCGNFLCNGPSCYTTCTLDTQCAAGNYCSPQGGCVPFCSLDSDCLLNEWCDTSTSECVAKSATGSVCTGGNQCTTSNCVDGFCCNNLCNTTCKSCSTAGSQGTCVFLPVGGTDDNPACNGVNACNGGSLCKLASGQPCSLGNQCASTVCTASVCQ